MLSGSTIHLRYESQQELNVKFIVNISVTADSSPLSPMGSAKENTSQHSNSRTSGNVNGYVKVCTTTRTPSRPMWTTTSTSTTCARSEHACTQMFVFFVIDTSHSTFAQGLLSPSFHPHSNHVRLSLTLFDFTFHFSLLFSFLFLSFFLMSDYDDDSVTNNLRYSANGTFVTLDDHLPLTGHEPNAVEVINDTEKTRQLIGSRASNRKDKGS